MSNTLALDITRDAIHQAALTSGWQLDSTNNGVDNYSRCAPGSSTSHEITVVYDASNRAVAAHSYDWDTSTGHFIGSPVLLTGLHDYFTSRP